MKILEYIVLIALAAASSSALFTAASASRAGLKPRLSIGATLWKTCPRTNAPPCGNAPKSATVPASLTAPRPLRCAANTAKRCCMPQKSRPRAGCPPPKRSPREAPKRCPAHRLRKSPVQRKRLYKRRPHRNISCTKRTAHGTRKTAAIGCFILYISVQAGAVCECTGRSVRSSSNRTV